MRLLIGLSLMTLVSAAFAQDHNWDGRNHRDNNASYGQRSDRSRYGRQDGNRNDGHYGESRSRRYDSHDGDWHGVGYDRGREEELRADIDRLWNQYDELRSGPNYPERHCVARGILEHIERLRGQLWKMGLQA